MSTSSQWNESAIDAAAVVASVGQFGAKDGVVVRPALTEELQAAVVDISREVFPGKCEFTTENDFENPVDNYIVVNVSAAGEPKEIVDRSHRWHERIRQISPDLSQILRLSIVPR